MMIKTADGEKSVGSAGVAGTGLGLGIAGTALALLNNGNCGNGGILGNLFGGNCNPCGMATHDSRVISALESELARVTSERYADSVGISTFKEAIALSNKNDDKINANYKELAQAFASLDKQIAVENQRVDCNFRYLDNKIDTKAREVYEYVNGHFVPGKLIMPKSSICPEPLSACVPVAFEPQSITTENAGNQGVIVANRTAASK